MRQFNATPQPNRLESLVQPSSTSTSDNKQSWIGQLFDVENQNFPDLEALINQASVQVKQEQQSDQMTFGAQECQATQLFDSQIPSFPSSTQVSDIQGIQKQTSETYSIFLDYVQSYIKFLADSETSYESEDVLLNRLINDLKQCQTLAEISQTLQIENSLSFGQNLISQHKINEDKSNQQLGLEISFKDSKLFQESFEEQSVQRSTGWESFTENFGNQEQTQQLFYQDKVSVCRNLEKTEDSKSLITPFFLSDDGDQSQSFSFMDRLSDINYSDKDTAQDQSMQEDVGIETQRYNRVYRVQKPNYFWSNPELQFLLQALKATKCLHVCTLHNYMIDPKTKRPDGIESIRSRLAIKHKINGIAAAGIKKDFQDAICCQIFSQIMKVKNSQKEMAERTAKITQKVIRKRS